MTEQEMQQEIQARVEFKMNELITGLKNRTAMEWNIAFKQGSPKHAHYSEAFEIVKEMIEKERDMSVPFNAMMMAIKSKAKEKAVDKVVNSSIGEHFRGRDHRHFVSVLVEAIETAQNF